MTSRRRVKFRRSYFINLPVRRSKVNAQSADPFNGNYKVLPTDSPEVRKAKIKAASFRVNVEHWEAFKNLAK
jgi:hypothetical protein